MKILLKIQQITIYGFFESLCQKSLMVSNLLDSDV